MGDGAIKAMTIGMQIGAFELKFNAGILKQKLLARSKTKSKQDSSQRTERTYVRNWVEEKGEENDFAIEDVEVEVAAEVDEVAENTLLVLAAMATPASDAVLCVETSLTRSGADTLATLILLKEALSISEESK